MPPSFPSLPLPEAAAAVAHAALLALAALLLLLRAARALASRCASCLKPAPRRGRAAAGGGGGALAATAGAWHRAVLASCAYALLLQVAALSYEVAVAGSRVAAGELLLPAVQAVAWAALLALALQARALGWASFPALVRVCAGRGWPRLAGGRSGLLAVGGCSWVRPAAAGCGRGRGCGGSWLAAAFGCRRSTGSGPWRPDVGGVGGVLRADDLC